MYLYYSSEAGEYILLGSDAISHSYRNHKRKAWLTQQIQGEVIELREAGATIGAYTIFPSNKIDGKNSINQARGINRYIDYRFDLTLECIRLFYKGQQSPLYGTLLRYESFFRLFESFDRYVRFFLFDDLIDGNQNIRFYLPFDNFNTYPSFSCIDDY